VQAVWRVWIAMGMVTGLLLGTTACSSTRRLDPTVDSGTDRVGSVIDAPAGSPDSGHADASHPDTGRNAPLRTQPYLA
jgi:hypothetical protein